MGHLLEELEEPLSVLYYGEGGTGKTTHLAHMADLGKIVVIDAERGLKVRALKKCGVDVGNIELWPGPDGGVTYQGLEAEILRIREALHQDPTAYAGMYWDSLTEIYKVLLDEVRGAAFSKSLNTHKPRESELFTDRADYGDASEQVRKLIRKCRDLTCHFGASALERRDQEGDASVKFRPAVPPGLQNDLYLWFDVICHTSVVEGEEGEEDSFRGQFKPGGMFAAKDRFKSMPRVLVEPTFDRVLAYVEEDLSLQTDPVMQEAKTNTKKESK